MLTFVGPRPKGCTVNHIDAVKNNNALTNLEYMTRADNIRQSFRDGLHPVRAESPSAKLTESQVVEIKSLIGTIPNTHIAKRYGVSDAAIRKIKKGITWR